MIPTAASAVAVAVAAPAAGVVVAPAAGLPRAASNRHAFAATLAREPQIDGPRGWQVIDRHAAWAALAVAKPGQRQAARWALARSLIGSNRGPEARGVLDTMRADDPELMQVASFRLALAAALVVSRDLEGAARFLANGPDAPHGPEACAWRLRAFAANPQAALGQFNCSFPALNARPIAARRIFLISAARAALSAGRPVLVKPMLRGLANGDLAAGLERGRAALALGDVPEARRQLGPVEKSGAPQQRVAAELTLLEHDFAARSLTPAAAGRTADRLAFVWRGDSLERRALLLSYRAGLSPDDPARRLAAGAALVRHFPLDATLAPVLAELQSSLARSLARDSRLSVDRAAGLYWEYRDLTPAGAAGDFLVTQLADRLQERGLYARAADLLKHLLLVRAKDIAQGPLSVRVASLYILAGQPGEAVQVMRATDAVALPADMTFARRRVEGVALFKLGRIAEALAVVQDVPDAAIIRAEIFWQRRDWPALAVATGARLPGGGKLGQIDQVIVLRHAIALAMLGREPALAALRQRYLSSFGGAAGSSSFDMLTRDPAALDENVFARAMLALPQISPVADLGDLFDAPATPAATPRPARAAAQPRK